MLMKDATFFINHQRLNSGLQVETFYYLTIFVELWYKEFIVFKTFLSFLILFKSDLGIIISDTIGTMEHKKDERSVKTINFKWIYNRRNK